MKKKSSVTTGFLRTVEWKGKKLHHQKKKKSAVTSEVSRVVSDWTDRLGAWIREGNVDVTTGWRCFTLLNKGAMEGTRMHT